MTCASHFQILASVTLFSNLSFQNHLCAKIIMEFGKFSKFKYKKIVIKRLFFEKVIKRSQREKNTIFNYFYILCIIH